MTHWSLIMKTFVFLVHRQNLFLKLLHLLEQLLECFSFRNKRHCVLTDYQQHESQVYGKWEPRDVARDFQRALGNSGKLNIYDQRRTHPLTHGKVFLYSICIFFCLTYILHGCQTKTVWLRWKRCALFNLYQLQPTY